MKHLDGQRMGQRADGFHDFARRADRSGHDDLAVCLVGNFAGQFGGNAAQLVRALFSAVQLEPRGIRAKGVGQEYVAA